MRFLLLSLCLLACKDDPTPTQLPDCTIGFADRDGDGFGNPNMQTSDCQEPVVDNDLDCDDQTTAVNPDAIEICDMIDNDCDGAVDLDDEDVDGAEQWPDADGDGYGDADADAVSLCEAIEGYAPNDLDCDDLVDVVNPEAADVCDGVDNDCDGLLDDLDDNWDPTGAPSFWEDTDGDFYGATTEVVACEAPEGFVSNDDDCDDTDALVYPGAPELCNNTDSNCDGGIDGPTTELDFCADLEQSYDGPYTVVLDSGSETRTCTGTASVTVDRAQTPVVRGSFSCTLDQAAGSWALNQTGTLEGWVTREGVAGGTLDAFAGTARDWDGTITPTGADGSADGQQIDGATAWALDASWDLGVSAP